MAFFKQGYRYHTKYDDFEHIPLGSFQHVGDNALSLVRSLANAPEVSNPKDNPGKIIFYDFLGLFMISYTQTLGHVVNYVVVVLSLAIFAFSAHTFKIGYSKQTLIYFSLTFGAIIGGWIAAAVFVVLISLLTDKIGYSMSWYGNPWLIFGLYVAPTVAFSSALLSFIRHERLTHNVKAQIQAHCVRFIWTLVLFIGSILNIRSMYALLIPLLFNTIGFILIHIFKLQHTVRKWQVIYVVSLIIPTMFLMYTALLMFSLFIPVTGRSGSNKNVDLLIGLLSSALTIVIISPYVALTTLVRHFKYLLAFLTLVFAISFVIIFTPLGFPYTGNTNSPAPQRYWMLHTRRVLHDENGAESKGDSGYLLLNMDRNSPQKVKNHVKDIARAKSLNDYDYCKKYLMCGLPQINKYSSWIPAGQPVLHQPVKLDVSSIVQVSPTVLRYNVSITGPDRVRVCFSPKKGHKVLAISLIDKMPSDSKTAVWNDRYLYHMTHVCGKEIAPLKFSFDLEVPANSSGATTEIAVSGIYVHDNLNRKTPHYVKFLNEFPDWADLTAWLACYESLWI
ncbi:hypothetical protein MTP99_001746 [Tenebrio molitor]|nr:hypothetical protein MTP99_001746 [Tenebrio molitor]